MRSSILLSAMLLAFNAWPDMPLARGMMGVTGLVLFLLMDVIELSAKVKK